MTPIQAFPVLFWYTQFHSAIYMQDELNRNIIYKN